MKKFSRILALALTLCTLLSCVVGFSLTSSAEVGRDESGWTETNVWNSDYLADATPDVKPYGTVFTGEPHMNGPGLMVVGSTEAKNPFVIEDSSLKFTFNSTPSVYLYHYITRSTDPTLGENFAVHYQFYFSAEEAFPTFTMRVRGGTNRLNWNLAKVNSNGEIQYYTTDGTPSSLGQMTEGWNNLSYYFILDPADDTYDIYCFLETGEIRTAVSDDDLATACKIDTSTRTPITKADAQATSGTWNQGNFYIEYRDFSEATAEATQTFRVKNLITNTLVRAEKGSAPAEEVGFYGANMVLGSELLMNYYVAKADVPEGATPSAKCDGQDLAAPASVKLDGVDYYQFTASVAASDIGVAKQIELYTTVGDVTTLQTRLSYSAAEYLANIFTSSDTPSAMKPLIEAIIYYGDATGGTAASTAFTANGGTLTSSAAEYAATFSSSLLKYPALTENAAYDGLAITLTDNLQLVVTSSDAAKIRVTVNDEEIEYDFVSGEAVIDCLHAAQLNTQVTLVLLDADGGEIADSTLEYSISGYLAAMIEMGQSVDMAKTVALYMTAARDYYVSTVEE